MKQSSFLFPFTENLIAKYPPQRRHQVRMLVVNRNKGTIEHKTFSDFPNYFGAGDVVVLNNSKVFPAILHGQKEKKKETIEVSLFRDIKVEKEHVWDTSIDLARKIRTRNKIFFGDTPLAAEIVQNTSSKGRLIEFKFDGSAEELKAIIEKIGKPPIPAQLKRAAEDIDRERYQTVFAEQEGATVAPDGSLFFTQLILKTLAIKKGVGLPRITFFMNPKSLLKIDAQDLDRYQATCEFYEIRSEAADQINKAKKEGKQICAAGYGALKTIESSAQGHENLVRQNSAPQKELESKNWSNMFIHPPYSAKVATSFLTNLHVPGSMPTLAALGFVGTKTDLLMEAYHEAVKRKYNFFLYGDALLIL